MGLRFCEDAACNNVLSGEPFADAGTYDWTDAAFLFDSDPSTKNWKTRFGKVAGKAFAGLSFSELVHVSAIGIQPGNIAYHMEEVFVEYLDINGNWVILTELNNIPRSYGEIGSGGPKYPNDVWYTASLYTDVRNGDGCPTYESECADPADGSAVWNCSLCTEGRCGRGIENPAEILCRPVGWRAIGNEPIMGACPAFYKNGGECTPSQYDGTTGDGEVKFDCFGCESDTCVVGCDGTATCQLASHSASASC